MGARGINVAQEGHIVNILPPQALAASVKSQGFHMHMAAKLNIILQFGAQPTAETSIQLFAATDGTLATAVPIPYDKYSQEITGTSNDVLSARVAVPAAGYAAPGVANTFYVFHLQADQLPQGYAWLYLSINGGTATDFASAVAILTGLRQGGDSNPTATS